MNQAIWIIIAICLLALFIYYVKFKKGGSKRDIIPDLIIIFAVIGVLFSFGVFDLLHFNSIYTSFF